MTGLTLSLLFSMCAGANAILPNYDDSPSLENGLSDHINNKIFPDPIELDWNRRIVRKNNDTIGLAKKENETVGKLKNSSALESLKDLEKMITHPTWLTDSSMKKTARSEKLQKNSIPLSMSHTRPVDYAENQQQHIKEVIEKFKQYKPKPITDNRITKFVFTNDADLATSRTVQEHNKEVARAFVDFNKKLEDTMSSKPKQKLSCLMPQHDMDDSIDAKHSNFLDKSLNRLKSNSVHKQVCSKHNKHMEEFEVRKPIVQASGVRKVAKMAKMRGDLENVLDRPKIKFKRKIN